MLFCWSLKEMNHWFLIYRGLQTETSPHLFEIYFGLITMFCKETNNIHLFCCLFCFDPFFIETFWSFCVFATFGPFCFWVDLVASTPTRSTQLFQLGWVYPIESTRGWPNRNNKIIYMYYIYKNIKSTFAFV
jgi:hypothetical protein